MAKQKVLGMVVGSMAAFIALRAETSDGNVVAAMVDRKRRKNSETPMAMDAMIFRVCLVWGNGMEDGMEWTR